ncbi:MAG: arylamine N-acetyltransferase [Thermoanaerobaculia bacterium]
MDTRSVDAVLDALGLERRPPDGRFFEDVFLRFQRRIGCETLTRPAEDPQAFDAERFFAEWADEEWGLVGEERARAFEWLAREIGFDVSLAEGTCVHPWAAPERYEVHRAVLVSIEGRHILADAAFPLPVLLSLDPPAREIPTGFGMLSVARPDGSDKIRVTCDGRGEVAELLSLLLAPAERSFPFEEICRPSPGAKAQHDAKGSRTSFALRLLDDRVLFWSAGRMTILDAWSRLEYALPASERSAIEKLFALELGDVVLPREADEDPAKSATLSVFHLSPVAADKARTRIARETPPYSLVASRELRIEESGAGSRLGIHATLAEPVPPAGPGEAVRKTLVFHLVSELFELSRG